MTTAHAAALEEYAIAPKDRLALAALAALNAACDEQAAALEEWEAS